MAAIRTIEHIYHAAQDTRQGTDSLQPRGPRRIEPDPAPNRSSPRCRQGKHVGRVAHRAATGIAHEDARWGPVPYESPPNRAANTTAEAAPAPCIPAVIAAPARATNTASEAAMPSIPSMKFKRFGPHTTPSTAMQKPNHPAAPSPPRFAAVEYPRGKLTAHTPATKEHRRTPGDPRGDRPQGLPPPRRPRRAMQQQGSIDDAGRALPARRHDHDHDHRDASPARRRDRVRAARNGHVQYLVRDCQAAKIAR